MLPVITSVSAFTLALFGAIRSPMWDRSRLVPSRRRGTAQKTELQCKRRDNSTCATKPLSHCLAVEVVPLGTWLLPTRPRTDVSLGTICPLLLWPTPPVLHDPHLQTTEDRSHFGSSHFGSRWCGSGRTYFLLLAFLHRTCYASQEMAQRGLVSPVVAVVDGTTTTIGAVATCTPTSSTRGSYKGRRRSQPAHTVPAAKLSKLEVALSALDAESPEGVYLKSVIDKTRVHVGQGHPGKRLDECQQYMVRAGKRLELAVATAVAEQEREQEEYNIGSAAIPPPMEVDNTSDRIQHLEALVTEFRKERDDCDHTVQRRSELARSPWTRQDWFPKRWKSCHSGSRPHLQGCRWPWSGKISPLLPSCLHSRQGGMKLASAKRRCNPGSALVVMK